jgi:DNA mismatch repair protein MutH
LNYDERQDFARVKMNLKTLPSPVETLKIEVASTSGTKGTLSVLWESTDAWVPITVLH